MNAKADLARIQGNEGVRCASESGRFEGLVFVFFLLLVTMGLPGCGGTAGSPSSNPNPPSSPGSSGTASSVTKDGITWTFDRTVPVGQFVIGDSYVVGAVTVIAIRPTPRTSSPYMKGRS